jgi:hypothetical protein
MPRCGTCLKLGRNLLPCTNEHCLACAGGDRVRSDEDDQILPCA